MPSTAEDPVTPDVQAGVDYLFLRRFHKLLHQNVGSTRNDSVERVVEAYHALCRRLRPTLSLEIGAFEASFSLRMKRELPECRVVAYEANPYVHEHFREEVTAGGVDYRQAAVATESGTIKIKVPMDFRGKQRNRRVVRVASLQDAIGTEESEGVEVEAVSLDDAYPRAEQERIVAWIDVEGATQQVLTGARGVLSRALAVYIEVEYEPIWEGQWLDGDVVRFFGELGFSVVLCDYAKKGQLNILFVRHEIARKRWVARLAADVFRPRAVPRSPRPPASLPRRVLRRLRG